MSFQYPDGHSNRNPKMKIYIMKSANDYWIREGNPTIRLCCFPREEGGFDFVLFSGSASFGPIVVLFI
jgi:hypothetical protein